jgi:hypothetical protein
MLLTAVIAVVIAAVSGFTWFMGWKARGYVKRMQDAKGNDGALTEDQVRDIAWEIISEHAASQPKPLTKEELLEFAASKSFPVTVTEVPSNGHVQVSVEGQVEAMFSLPEVKPAPVVSDTKAPEIAAVESVGLHMAVPSKNFCRCRAGPFESTTSTEWRKHIASHMLDPKGTHKLREA